jgi:hypothetical protein
VSALFQRVPPRVAGGTIDGTDGLTAPDHFYNGLGYEADGTLSVAVGGTVDHYHQGLPFTSGGRLVVAATAVDHYGSGAAPFTATGVLSITGTAPTGFEHGVGFNAGSVSMV